MNVNTQHINLSGAAGAIEVAIDRPQGVAPRGIALPVLALPVPSDTLVIHHEADETVPLSAVLDRARPQQLPVVVVPGAEHFFHRRLTRIKDLVIAAWLGERAERSTPITLPPS